MNVSQDGIDIKSEPNFAWSRRNQWKKRILQRLWQVGFWLWANWCGGELQARYNKHIGGSIGWSIGIGWGIGWEWWHGHSLLSMSRRCRHACLRSRCLLLRWRQNQYSPTVAATKRIDVPPKTRWSNLSSKTSWWASVSTSRRVRLGNYCRTPSRSDCCALTDIVEQRLKFREKLADKRVDVFPACVHK